MAHIIRRSTPTETVGDLPAVGTKAPAFLLTDSDLSDVTRDHWAGRRLVLNIFPSVDTGTCATSVRKFNELASTLENTTVVCVSNDLPYAQTRFCGAEGLSNVATVSAFRSDFGDTYGVRILDGGLRRLLARAVVVLDTDGTVIHTELVDDIGHEPNYDAAIAVL
ncbi:MAG: thiol peroxidase [Propionibacteriaceae bacterium]